MSKKGLLAGASLPVLFYMSGIASAAETGQQVALLAPTAKAVEEIVVTARKRVERVQTVPIAISVIGAKSLETTGTYHLEQLQQLAPSLQVLNFNPRNANINIRNLGSNVALANDGLENGVGIYVDQVYLGRVGLSQFDLVDLDRIEILRGPQGTLYGKNTTAGAINISTKAPSFTPEGTAEISLGNYNTHQIRGYISGPIVADKIAASISVSDTFHSGYVYNRADNSYVHRYHDFSVRGQVLIKPGDDLKIRLIGEYGRIHQNCCISVPVGLFTTNAAGQPIYDDAGVAPANNFVNSTGRLGYTPVFDPDNRIVDANSPFQADMWQQAASAQVDWDLGENQLTSITAWRSWNWYPGNDTDLTSLPVNTKNHINNFQKQFSQEFRIASTGKRKIDYVAGAYYFWQRIIGNTYASYGSAAPAWFRTQVAGAVPTASTASIDRALNGFTAEADSVPSTFSSAVFGQAVWHITDPLSLTVGLRYNHEIKQGSFTQYWLSGADVSADPDAVRVRNIFNRIIPLQTIRRDDNSLSGTASLGYQIDQNALVYATYSRGNKSGGLNLTALPAALPASRASVEPERVDHFELGLKSQFLDNHVTANLSAFLTNVKNYQTSILDTSLPNVPPYIANIPKARSKGFEFDASWVVSRQLSFTASGTYADATYVDFKNGPVPVELRNFTSYDLSGKPLSGSPKFSFSLGADGFVPLAAAGLGDLEAYGHVDYAHRSSYFMDVSDSRYSHAPAYGLTNLRIGLRADSKLWDLSFYAKNLFDTKYYTQLRGNAGASFGLVSGLLGDPRTLGGTLRVKF